MGLAIKAEDDWRDVCCLPVAMQCITTVPSFVTKILRHKPTIGL